MRAGKRRKPTSDLREGPSAADYYRYRLLSPTDDGRDPTYADFLAWKEVPS
jgi:hypothetical protein